MIGTMISKLLFIVSGIISGHSPNHFWSFFSSTGKKVIKISTENVFVIITFSVNIVEQMVAPYWSSSLVWRLSTGAFQEYLEAQRAEIQHRAGEATLTTIMYRGGIARTFAGACSGSG